MKKISSRLLVSALSLAILTSVSCMTTYDPYGRPMQTVDPGLALVGIAAAGLIGYAAGNRDDRYDQGYYYRDDYYGGYARQGRGCR